MKHCVENGMTRCNVNELVLNKYSPCVNGNAGKVPLTTLIEEGVKLIQELAEWQIVVFGFNRESQVKLYSTNKIYHVSPKHDA
jgi:fructose-bisphosphate aldolase class II